MGSGNPDPVLCPGNVYTVHLEEAEHEGAPWKGGYGVVKVLAVRPPLVFLRFYRNRWNNRPVDVDWEQLVVGRVSDPEGFGISCIGLRESLFMREAAPEYLERAPVTSEELERAEEQLRVNGLSDAADAGTRAADCGPPTAGGAATTDRN